MAKDDIQLLISLDYDDCYSHDPEFWNEFIGLCKKYEHDVICVTSRNEQKDPIKNHHISELIYTVIYTNGNPKKETAEAYGYFVDIWIDDMPELVHGNVIRH